MEPHLLRDPTAIPVLGYPNIDRGGSACALLPVSSTVASTSRRQKPRCSYPDCIAPNPSPAARPLPFACSPCTPTRATFDPLATMLHHHGWHMLSTIHWIQHLQSALRICCTKLSSDACRDIAIRALSHLYPWLSSWRNASGKADCVDGAVPLSPSNLQRAMFGMAEGFV